MEIIVLNEDQVQKFETEIPHIVISIRSPKTDTITIPCNKSNVGVLFLAFHDLDHNPEGKGIVLGASKPYILFNEENAKEILSFVSSHINDIELIVVNCEAGISRSAGVAAALSKVINGDDEIYFKEYLPNRLVYRTLLNVSQDYDLCKKK